MRWGCDAVGQRRPHDSLPDGVAAGRVGGSPYRGAMSTSAAHTTDAASFADEAALTADDVLADVRGAARTMVRGGFLTYDEVLSRALELAALADVVPSAGSVERAVRHEWDARVAEQAAWSAEAARSGSADAAVGDEARLERAFAELEHEGVLARAAFECCEECGERELRSLAGATASGWAFFPRSGLDALEAGRLTIACGGTAGTGPQVAERVRERLAAHGLQARVEGTHVVVRVTRWRKRLPAADAA